MMVLKMMVFENMKMEVYLLRIYCDRIKEL